MFKNLVVALDLESDGDRALPVVEALTRRSSARVDLITVSSPGMPSTVDAWELERRARRHGWERDGWTVVHDVDVADGIVQHAAGVADPLVVMATDARGSLAGRLVPGIPHDVLRRWGGPVLLIGPNVPHGWAPPRTTLVAWVGREDPTGVVAAILAWQRTFEARPPVLVDVVRSGEPGGPVAGRLAAVAEQLAAAGVPADTTVLHGDDRVSTLDAHAGRLDGAVHVAASAHLAEGRVHWHRTTRELLRGAARPVLVVPDPSAPLARPVTVAADLHTAFHSSAVLPAGPLTPIATA
jgi:nucleotide-binding universal stress UspA family protein